MRGAKLLEVADMLDNLPLLTGGTGRLDMNNWGPYPVRDGTGAECGTACCVAGWVTKLLPHLGLTIAGRSAVVKFAAGGERYYEFSALRHCFDIPYADARRLFGYEQPNDPAKLAALFREYVADQEAASVPA